MFLQPQLDLANLALVLVMLAALTSLWLAPWLGLLSCAVAVMAFNFHFVPPTGTFQVNFHQHMLLLLAMWLVSAVVTLLVGRQKRLRLHAQQESSRARELRELSEQLRSTDDQDRWGDIFLKHLSGLVQPKALLMLDHDGHPHWRGEHSALEESGLHLCSQMSSPMGPGTGRHDEQPDCYLPLRGSRASHGAVLLPPMPPQWHAHLQSLCDMMGMAMERQHTQQQAQRLRQAEQTQALRSTLLTAIAHDHRTPLATILSAATALRDQGERMGADQQRQLASVIADEAQQLARLTENTLQLARLDTPGVVLQTDWESIEELVGTVARRSRVRHPFMRLRTLVDQGLPLIRCDALLMVQLLDNLMDNAVVHGSVPGEDAVVDIKAVMLDATSRRIRLSVEDRGPGVPDDLQDSLFEVFTRHVGAQGHAGQARRAGAGVGLAVCKAIARVHGWTLRHEAGSSSGASFVLELTAGDAP